MIKLIFDLLQNDELPVGDSDIDFAKGSHKYPSSYKEAFKLTKRRLRQRWQKV